MEKLGNLDVWQINGEEVLRRLGKSPEVRRIADRFLPGGRWYSGWQELPYGSGKPTLAEKGTIVPWPPAHGGSPRLRTGGHAFDNRGIFPAATRAKRGEENLDFFGRRAIVGVPSFRAKARGEKRRL